MAVIQANVALQEQMGKESFDRRWNRKRGPSRSPTPPIHPGFGLTFPAEFSDAVKTVRPPTIEDEHINALSTLANMMTAGESSYMERIAGRSRHEEVTGSNLLDLLRYARKDEAVQPIKLLVEKLGAELLAQIKRAPHLTILTDAAKKSERLGEIHLEQTLQASQKQTGLCHALNPQTDTVISNSVVSGFRDALQKTESLQEIEALVRRTVSALPSVEGQRKMG